MILRCISVSQCSTFQSYNIATMGTMTLLSQFSSWNTFLPDFPSSLTVIHFTSILSRFPATNPYSQRERAEFQTGRGEAVGSTMAVWDPLQNWTSQEEITWANCAVLSLVRSVKWCGCRQRGGHVHNLPSEKLRFSQVFRVASDQWANEASLSYCTAEGCLGERAIQCSAGARH